MKKKEDFVKTSFPYIILGLVIIIAFLFYNNTRFEVPPEEPDPPKKHIKFF